MKVLFLHGLESKPGGTKAKYIESLGHTVLNPHLPKESFEKSVQIAQDVFDNEQPDIIVGSSRGGAVALSMGRQAKKTVLIAPAYKKFGTTPSYATRSGDTVILHSMNDDIIPVKDSMELVDVCNYSLFVCGLDHRMSDEEALKELGNLLNEKAQ